MTTALALRGGGARGSFEVGAIKCLYTHFGVRPDLLATCSVGSINGVKLAEARVGLAAEHLLALQQLEQIWYRLQVNDDMYVPAPWLATLLQSQTTGPAIRSALNGDSGADVDPEPSWLESPLVVHHALLLAAFVAPNEIATAIRGSREPSLFLLEPIDMMLRDPANLDPTKVALGTPLMMAVVSLESGALRYVMGDGRFVERDGRTPVASAIPAEITRCQLEANAFTALQDAISLRRIARAVETSPERKRRLDRELRSLHAHAQNAFEALQACLVSPGPSVTATVNLVDGVIASSTMPAIFPPVRLGLENYVDGGVREIVPISIALEMGASEIYAVLASSQTLPATRSFARKGFLSILEQALVEITLKEVTRDDLAPANPRGVPIHVIAPSFDVHGTTQIEPGLISIAKDYGYLRAGDVVTATPGFDRDLSTRLSDAIIMTRRDTWELEVTFASRAVDPGLRHPLLDELRLHKWVLKVLVAARRSLSAPTPPNAFQWHGHWERHYDSDPAQIIPNPWTYLISRVDTTPAESPATYVPDLWALREIGNDQLHQLLKGATFALGGTDDLRSVGYLSAAIVELPNHAIAALPKVPFGDTLLRETDSPVVWYCDGSHRYGSLTPAIIAALGLASSPVRLVPHGGLAQIPAGGALFWLGGLVVTDSALTVLRAWEPTPQLEGSSSSTGCYLYNRTSVPITVTHFEVTGDTTGAFTVNTAMPLVVHAGNRETVNLTFHPTQPGSISATLLIDCDDTTVARLWVPVVTSARPIGPHGRFAVSPTTLSFPNTVLGHVDGGRLTLDNIGDSDAAVYEIVLVDETPAQQFLVPPVLPPSVPPGKQQPLMLGFAPTGRGNAQATAILRAAGSANYSETHRITLTGRCVAPVLALRPAVLAFGYGGPGQQRSLPLDIANEGDAPLTLSGIFAVQGAAGSFFFQPSPSLPVTIPPGAVETMHVTYATGPHPRDHRHCGVRVRQRRPGQPTGPPDDEWHGHRVTHRRAPRLHRLPHGAADTDCQCRYSAQRWLDQRHRQGGDVGIRAKLPPRRAPNHALHRRGWGTARLPGRVHRPTLRDYVDRVIISSDDHRRPEIRNTVEATLQP